eukprot:m51a1_g2850 putative pf11578 family protein (157) ;mRNA; f:299245-299715
MAAPALEFSFAVDIVVDAPVVVNGTPEGGKRQLIPIRSGVVTGALSGSVLPGGIDSQIIAADGLCTLSARYALDTSAGRVYVENNGVRRVPPEWRARLFEENMSLFALVPQEQIYFRAVPRFEVYTPELRWLTESVFVCTGQRTVSGVSLRFYRVL